MISAPARTWTETRGASDMSSVPATVGVGSQPREDPQHSWAIPPHVGAVTGTAQKQDLPYADMWGAAPGGPHSLLRL